jgi:hypothetical protein
MEGSQMEGEPPVRPSIRTTAGNHADFLAITCNCDLRQFMLHVARIGLKGLFFSRKLPMLVEMKDYPSREPKLAIVLSRAL